MKEKTNTSANNYILIKELKNKRFKVVELDMETNCQFGKAIKCGNLREAVEIGSKMAEETEYGVIFDLQK